MTIHQHDNTRTRQYTNTTIHQRNNTQKRQYSNTTIHQHDNTPTQQYTNTTIYQHNNTPTQLYTNTRTNCMYPCRCCHRQLRPPLPFIIDCAAAAMAALDGSNSSCRQWKRLLMAVAAMVSLPPPSTPIKGWWRRHQLLLHSWQWPPPLPTPLLAKNSIVNDAIASSFLHPTASVNNDRRWQRPPLPRLPSTAVSIDNYCLCSHQQWTITTVFWWSSLSTVWQWQWWSLTAAIVAIVNGCNNEIERMASMEALSTVAVVDGGGNNGVFTTSYYDNDHHPCPHCPHPRPLSGKDRTVGWRAHHDASHLSWPRLLSLVPSLSPLTGQRCQGWQLWQQTRP